MAKTLTFVEFMDYAKAHYNKGGDSFVECWEEKDFNYYVEQFGPITKSAALEMFRQEKDIERDRAGYWQ